MTQIAPIKRQARPASGGNRNLEARVSDLERKVADMETKVDMTVENTAEILAVLTGAKGAVSFVKRYGPRVFVFASGVMTATGFGNPEVWKFISEFFH